MLSPCSVLKYGFALSSTNRISRLLRRHECLASRASSSKTIRVKHVSANTLARLFWPAPVGPARVLPCGNFPVVPGEIYSPYLFLIRPNVCEKCSDKWQLEAFSACIMWQPKRWGRAIVLVNAPCSPCL